MITIVNYGVGNVASLANMLEHIGANTQQRGNPELVACSPHLVLPGVGSYVLNATGLADAVRTALSCGSILLGVCLGMQLLARSSEEGNTTGLGFITADLKQILPLHSGIKIPNMGWR